MIQFILQIVMKLNHSKKILQNLKPGGSCKYQFQLQIQHNFHQGDLPSGCTLKQNLDQNPKKDCSLFCTCQMIFVLSSESLFIWIYVEPSSYKQISMVCMSFYRFYVLPLLGLDYLLKYISKVNRHTKNQKDPRHGESPP